MSSVLHTLGIDGRVLLVQAGGFVLLYLLLRRFLFGPVAGVLASRQQEIRGQLDEAAHQRGEAEKLREDYQQRLAAIRDEARQQVQQAVQEGHQVRERMLAEAREEVRQLLDRGRAEIDLERRKALVQLRSQVAELAIMAASKAIRGGFDQPAHRKAIDDFIAELEEASL